ncbi:MAG: hypothetical protein L3K18_09560 [Thermoplasmata archaeon]|nr:hypothetical protein [Thermoplasmata archaeon]
MAAAALGTGRYLSAQAGIALEDPLGYFIRTARKVGVGMLAAGAGMGVAAYYLQAAATAAMNNETAVLGNIGTIFSNIQAPSFTPAALGSAPVTASVAGVQNFFGDAWSDVQAAGADVAGIGSVIGTLAEDVGTGLADLCKAALAFVMHFPDILWNGLVWGIGGAVASILTWAFPWLILIGGCLIIASVVAYGAQRLWGDTVGAAWRESWEEKSGQLRAKSKAWFDRVLRVKRPRSPPELPDGEQPPPPEEPIPIVIDTPEGPIPVTEPDSGANVDEKVGGGVSDLTPEATDPPEDPLPAGWTQAEMEEYLGQAQTAAQDAA